MKRTLPLMLFGLVAICALALEELRAQQSANNTRIESTPARPSVLVFGAVRSPGRIEIENTRLAEAIKMAGGVTERLNGTILVIHSNSALTCFPPDGPAAKPAMIESRGFTPPPPSMDFYTLSNLRGGNMDENPQLQPGDLVVVVEAPPVYIVGSVNTPQALYLREGMTLTRAIAMAGGLLRDSNPKKVRIIRIKADSREIVTVDLHAIRKHRAQDPVLQPYDIIEVPERHRSPGMHRRLDARQLPMRVIT